MSANYTCYKSPGLRQSAYSATKKAPVAQARPSFTAATTARPCVYTPQASLGEVYVDKHHDEGDSHHHHHHHDKVVAKEVVDKHAHAKCGFPWWILAVILGIAVAGLVWIWWEDKKRKERLAKAATAAASGAAAVGAAALSSMAHHRSMGISDGSQSSAMMPEAAPSPSPSPVAAPALQRGVMRTTSDEVEKLGAAGQPALVIYTSDTCHLCPSAFEEVRAAADYLVIPVLQVERDSIPKDRRPPGYPQIFVVTPDNQRQVFEGQRTRDSILDFVVTNLGQNALIPAARR
jgi:hypothetical protein